VAVTLTGDQIARAADALQHIAGGAGKAMSRAINRAIQGARTAATKQIRRVYRIKSGDVKATMTLRRATPSNLSASVTSRGKRINLYAFAPRPSASGTGGKGRRHLTISVLRGRRTRHRSAWVGSFGKSARLRVAMRKGPKRFPIRALSGPAVPQMLGTRDVIAEVEKVAAERLDKRLDHEIGVLLKRLDRRL